VFLGTIPIFILAGFIEGFITRETDWPTSVRLAVIIASLIIIIGYYIVYPLLLSKEKQDQYAFVSKNDEPVEYHYVKDEIKNTGQVFSHTMRLLRKLLPKLIGALILPGVAFALLFGTASYLELLPDRYEYVDFFSYEFFFTFSEYPEIYPLIVLLMTIVTYRTTRVFHRFVNPEAHFSGGEEMKIFLSTMMITGLLLLFFFIDSGWATIIFLLNLPVWMLSIMSIREDGPNPFRAIGKGLQFANVRFGRVMLNFIAIGFLAFLFFYVLQTPFTYYSFQLISWNLPVEEELATLIMSGVIWVLLLTILSAIASLLMLGSCVNFYSLMEAMTAKGLIKQIESIGTRKTIYGMEREQ
jgi:hypothetical protein